MGKDQGLWMNMTDRQFTGLLGVINEPTGFEVEYPSSGGEVCNVKHFSGVLWTIEPDGTVGQTTEHV